MDYDIIVNDVAEPEMFGYEIFKGNVKLKWRQNKKKAKAAGPSQLPVPEASPANKTLREKVRVKRKAQGVNKTPPGSPKATPSPSMTSPPSSGWCPTKGCRWGVCRVTSSR
jgi:hypothetical protein